MLFSISKLLLRRTSRLTSHTDASRGRSRPALRAKTETPVSQEPVLRQSVPSLYQGRNFEMLGTILIVALLLLLLGAWPSWPYSRGWGYYPSGTLGLVLVIVLVLALMGRV
jgi:hypothetical protein